MKLRCPVSKFIAHTISHVFFLALLAFATFGSGEELGDLLLPDDDHDNHEHDNEEGGHWSFIQSELCILVVMERELGSFNFKLQFCSRSFRMTYFHVSNATMSCTNSKRDFDIRNLPSTHSKTSSSSGFSVRFVSRLTPRAKKLNRAEIARVGGHEMFIS